MVHTPFYLTLFVYILSYFIKWNIFCRNKLVNCWKLLFSYYISIVRVHFSYLLSIKLRTSNRARKKRQNRCPHPGFRHCIRLGQAKRIPLAGPAISERACISCGCALLSNSGSGSGRAGEKSRFTLDFSLFFQSQERCPFL